jgi:bromodomain-containing factor 1
MDLGTVQAKVNAREYSSLDQFVDDVRLIFSNCYKFNGTDSPISLMAAEVEKAFDRAVYKIPPAPTVSILHASITVIATTHHIFPISLLLRK